MGLRFRRSVRLFPGVRLNFSRSGVSTSIGVRGATVTVGPRGAYANVGLPGTGLSYRSRLDTPVPPPRADRGDPGWNARRPQDPIFHPGTASIPGTEVEVTSGDVSTLTSPGLGELKQLINTATFRHAELSAELGRKRKALDKAAKRLRRAQFFIIRIFTANVIPRLVDDANAASQDLEETHAHLEGCFVEVDFAFNDEVRNTYAALIESFEKLRTSQRIWDITSTAAVDRVAQRTSASSAFTRIPVVFGFADADIIRSRYRGMRLENAGGRDLHIFPGFVMMRDSSGDFALIEFSQFQCEYAQSNFIEEEFVPSDAEQIGTTWKRANKDGSPDRRFNNNYQIPVMRYGALALSSPTGLAEVYQISNFEKAAGFAKAILAHKRALDNLDIGTDLPALPAPASGEDDAADYESEAEPTFSAKSRANLLVDWMVMLLLVGAIGLGGIWGVRHWPELKSATTPPPPATAQPSASPQPNPGARAPPRRHGHHNSHHRR